jgi:hypothetical protein
VATSVSCGCPCWLDYVPMDGQTPFRQYDIGTRVHNIGTASSVQVPSGVFPGTGAMAVTAASGMYVTVSAGYCCIASSSGSLDGGYVFGLLTSQLLQVAASSTAAGRLDAVAAWVDDNSDDTSAAYVGIITGTPSASPVLPSLPASSLLLAQVAVGQNVTSVLAGNISDQRTWVVAPGGILPISTAAAAPAVPASQFMYTMDTGELVQGTGTAGSVTSFSGLKWTPQISFLTSAKTAASAGALTTLATVSVTTDGITDLEIDTKWAYLTGSAAQVTLSIQVDGTTVDEITVSAAPDYGYGAGGGSSSYYTSSAQSTTPDAGTHTITWKFQASGSGTSTSDGVYAAASAPAYLRVAPAEV